MNAVADPRECDDAVPRPRDFHLRWPTLQLPLRPDAAVAAAIDALLPVGDGQRLLLGVTPELANLPRSIIAVDWSQSMIDLAWPGDSGTRRAILADWRNMPIEPASVDAVMSDGAMTMLDWPVDAARLLRELARVVRTGGRVVMRCFATPLPIAGAEAVLAEARTGALGFHHFKLRFNMAVAREGPGISVASARLFARFQAMVPDRSALSAASGWSLATIAEMDAYANSAYVHSYPSRAELNDLAAVHWPGPTHFVDSAGYAGADLCPLWVLDRA